MKILDIRLWRYVNDVTKESYWLPLTFFHIEVRPRPRYCSMFCIEKRKQLGIMVSSKAATLKIHSLEEIGLLIS